MKHFITIISIIILSFTTFTVCGQDRVNRTKLSFQEESTKLTSITGWGYDNEAGEWIDCQNFIECQKKYKSYTSPSWVSHNDNNIISLQFKTVEYNNNILYILVWEKWGGHYLYPSIYEDWRYYKVKQFIIFSEEDMNKLNNLTNDVYRFEVAAAIKNDSNNDIEDVDVIQTGLKDISEYGHIPYSMEESIKIYKATDGSVRFTYGNMNIERAYFEITEKEYMDLITLK